MERDVKVGLVLGVLLVAVVAVVFFRRDAAERDKFAGAVPAPDRLVEKAKSVLGPSSTDPYHVPPEYLSDAWQSTPAKKPARESAATRDKRPDASDHEETSDEPRRAGSGVLLGPPQDGTAPAGSRARKSNAGASARYTSDADSRGDSGGEYTIAEGDTLSGIASRFLGSANDWPLLIEANPKVLHDPDRIPLGQRIRLPNSRGSSGARPSSGPTAFDDSRFQPIARSSRPLRDDRASSGRGIYEVEEGDSLIRISRKVYDDPNRWREIFDANADQLASKDDIRAGMILKLP